MCCLGNYCCCFLCFLLEGLKGDRDDIDNSEIEDERKNEMKR